jgi:hypothetical protein
MAKRGFAIHEFLSARAVDRTKVVDAKAKLWHDVMLASVSLLYPRAFSSHLPAGDCWK